MRADRTQSLRQRLRQRTQGFEFSALIDGVSTLEGDEQAEPQDVQAHLYGSPIDYPPPVAAPDPPDASEEATPDATAAPAAGDPAPQAAAQPDPEPVTGAAAKPAPPKKAVVKSAPAPLAAAAAEPAVQAEEPAPAPQSAPVSEPVSVAAAEVEAALFARTTVTPAPAAAPAVQPGPAPAAAEPGSGAGASPVVSASAEIAVAQPLDARSAGAYGAREADREERLKSILDALGRRLLAEAPRLSAAVHQADAAVAGERLARVNQLCELLYSVDPTGDLGRHLKAVAAPPDGRAWPRTCWTLAEFAESPFSALLPPDTTQAFLADMMFAAWGAHSDNPGAAVV